MIYLEYDKTTKQVTEIHETTPTLEGSYDYAISSEFKIGDEFEWAIWINQVDSNKNIISYSAVRNNPNARRLLQENKKLRDDLDTAVLELSSALAAMMGGGAGV